MPPLEWLEAFFDDRYRHGDLDRFGVPPRMQVDDKLRFSLIRRPAPYTRAPLMSLVSGSATNSQWDNVMSQLAHWLVRHLNDPALIIWLAERGGLLHDQWPWLIEAELDRFASLEKEGNATELAELRASAPNAIPQPLMQVLWRLLLTGRVKSPWRNLDQYRWKDRLKRDGLTVTARLQLRELLAPKLVLKKPFRWGESNNEAPSPVRLRQLVDWELVLAADHVLSWLRDLAEAEHWRSALPPLLDEFQQLLRDALDLLRELGKADEHSDRSHWDLPSISPHWQNRGFRDWIALIELLRDAWLAAREIDPERATRIAQGWFALPYPTFKRLALFAASHDRCIAADQWVDWLGADGAWWLWSVDTQRETMRLLVLQGAQLSPEARAKLESAILAGPPRAMYREDIEPDGWQSLVDRSVWLHLAKLEEGGSHLGAAALQRFKELSAANPEWRLSSNQREEFPFWMSGTGDPGYEDGRNIDIAPRKLRNLINWLKRPPPSGHPFYEDTWCETCRQCPRLSFNALRKLAQEGNWPAERWREALQAWTGKGRRRRSWRFAARLVQSMPDDVLQEIAHAVTSWLRGVSESIDRHETIFLELCGRVLALPHQDGIDTDQPVTRAINHPIGHVTEALIDLWLKRDPNDNDTLPADVGRFFTELCDTRVEQFRHGRVLLAAHLIALFRVDRSWTKMHLLPLFDWAKPVEAKAAWEGFLWSPRLYPPLLIAFKEQFLATAHYYGKLGEHSRQFAAFLTYAALDPVDGYSPQDFHLAIGALPQEGLEEAAQALAQSLEAAGEQQEEYWKNRVQPFWQQVWPKSLDLVSPRITASLARLSIAARGEFSSALSAVLNWLRPIEDPIYVVDLLHESGLAGRSPEDALRLLNALIDERSWPPTKLRHCLTAIAQAAPALEQDFRYQRLLRYSRQHGI